MKRILILSIVIAYLASGCKQSTSTPNVPIETVISDPNYMKECLQINPHRSQRQVNYRDIFSGSTKSNEVIDLLGEPADIYRYNDPGEEEWYYSTFSLRLNKDVVRKISLNRNEQSLSLSKYVELYGCPNVIFGIEPGDESPNGTLIFIFYEIGLELIFTGKDVVLTDKPERVIYFSPTSSISEYFEQEKIRDYYYTPPIPWSRAVN